MSKQLHDEGRREQSRRQQVKFRAEGELVEDFDEWVEASDHDNRATALRHVMRRCLGGPDIERAPLVPPTDERLRTAYLCLVDAANGDGYIPHNLALVELASATGERQERVGRYTQKLRERNYLLRKGNIYGRHAWKLVGWEDR